MWSETVTILLLIALLGVNAIGVLMVALQLPGTWMMLLATGLVAWWRWESQTFGAVTLVILLGLALVGEWVEFLAGMAGASMAGASRRAAWIALVGGVVGAIVGSVAIPILIVGTLVGAGVGAGLGSIAGDRWSGRSWKHAIKGGGGAAVGKLGGAVGKLAIAALMWLIVAIAMVV